MADFPKCLFAYTEPTQEPGVYCGYMNISQLEDGSVRVTVRERGPHPENCAQIVIPADQVRAVFR